MNQRIEELLRSRVPLTEQRSVDINLDKPIDPNGGKSTVDTESLARSAKEIYSQITLPPFIKQVSNTGYKGGYYSLTGDILSKIDPYLNKVREWTKLVPEVDRYITKSLDFGMKYLPLVQRALENPFESGKQVAKTLIVRGLRKYRETKVAQDKLDQVGTRVKRQYRVYHDQEQELKIKAYLQDNEEILYQVNYNDLPKGVNILGESNLGENRPSDINEDKRDKIRRFPNVQRIKEAKELTDLKEYSDGIHYIPNAYKINRLSLTSDSFWSARIVRYPEGDSKQNMLPELPKGYNQGYWPITDLNFGKYSMAGKDFSFKNFDITIPENVSFSTDIKVTVVDDEYRSFQRWLDLAIKTMYDRWSNTTLPYKNCLFRIDVWQYDVSYTKVLYKKFFLCTIKNPLTDFSGSADDSPVDHTINFSIVGEISTNDDPTSNNNLVSW